MSTFDILMAACRTASLDAADRVTAILDEHVLLMSEDDGYDMAVGCDFDPDDALFEAVSTL